MLFAFKKHMLLNSLCASNVLIWPLNYQRATPDNIYMAPETQHLLLYDWTLQTRQADLYDSAEGTAAHLNDWSQDWRLGSSRVNTWLDTRRLIPCDLVRHMTAAHAVTLDSRHRHSLGTTCVCLTEWVGRSSKVLQSQNRVFKMKVFFFFFTHWRHFWQEAMAGCFYAGVFVGDSGLHRWDFNAPRLKRVKFLKPRSV